HIRRALSQYPSVYASMNYDNYRYLASVIGRQQRSDYVPSVGIAYNPSEHLNVFANYSWQATDWYMAGFHRQPSSGGPAPPSFTAAAAGEAPPTGPPPRAR